MQSNEKHHKILNIINRNINLPSPPAIAVRILNAVQKDEAALSELGEIIASDPALTAKMLRVANSNLFDRNGSITNINRAMTVLGTNVIKNIALSFIIAENLVGGQLHGFDFDRFWRRAVTRAVSAELIAKQTDLISDDIFVMALLQDIGSLVIAMTKGEAYSILIREALSFDQELHLIEQEKYGFDHQQVGYALLNSWNIPDAITLPILCHHKPDNCGDEHQLATRILCVADQLCSIYFSDEAAEKARMLRQNLIETWQLPPQEADELIDRAATDSCEMLTAFELDPGEIKPYSTLLLEANQALADLQLSNEQMLLEMREAKERSEHLNSELKEANSKLKELVYRDGLTGLYNHRYFQESLSSELARAKRYQTSVSLILFDVDHFKKINDQHGHPAGDLVLMNIARAVSSAVRPSDIVARYGGEEFAVILPETNDAGARVFAARLRRCVEGIATLVEGQLIYATISAGTTTYTHQTTSMTKNLMIETADRGLYTAKQSGRNQVITLEPEIQ